MKKLPFNTFCRTTLRGAYNKLMMKILIIGIIGWGLLIGSVVNADTYDFRVAANKTCIPLSELRIADIGLLDSSDSILDKHGEPDSRVFEKTQIFLDPLEILTYPGLKIHLVNSNRPKVYWVTCYSPACSTPSGIGPGEPVERVSQVLGFDIENLEQPHYKSLNTYFIHRCIGEDEQIDVEQFFSVEVSDDGLISSIEIFWVAP